MPIAPHDDYVNPVTQEKQPTESPKVPNIRGVVIATIIAIVTFSAALVIGTQAVYLIGFLVAVVAAVYIAAQMMRM